MAAHARLGPSNHRWPNCPGSVREEARFPGDGGSSEAAIDGTGSHLLLELAMEQACFADDFIGELIGVNHRDKPGGWLVDDERAKRVQMCLDYIDRRVSELEEQHPDAEVKVEAESRADPGGMWGRDDYWGTVDITITVTQGGLCLFLEVVDYKDGRGYVSEKGNTQLLSYLIGKARPFIASGPDLVRPFNYGKVGGYRCTIVQPKTNPVIRYEDLDPSQVEEAAARLERASGATDDPDAPLITGDWCQWCRANPKRGGDCNAHTQQSIETMKELTNDVTAEGGGQSLFEQVNNIMTDVAAFTNEQLSELASARAGIEAAFDKVEEEMVLRIEQGQEVPGYAMKPGRSSKVWNEDEETIVKALKGRRLKQADIFPPKLLSPAQMMKSENLTDEQKKKLSDKYVTVKAGAMKLSKVARGEESNHLLKDVAESSDNVAQSATPSRLFKDVPEAKTEPVSFF